MMSDSSSGNDKRRFSFHEGKKGIPIQGVFSYLSKTKRNDWCYYDIFFVVGTLNNNGGAGASDDHITNTDLELGQN